MPVDGRLTVTVDVRNTGSVRGGEIVQLYVGDNESTVERPVRELKAFDKVFLDPGETKSVKFVLDRTALQYFDADRHDWQVEPGTFTVYVGASSRDLRGKVEFTAE